MDYQICEENFDVQPLYTDRNCKCTLPAIAQIFQDVAEKHTLHAGCDYFSMKKDGRAWVLSRMYYKIHQCPKIYEQCKVRTWSRGVDSVFALREFEMYNADNEVIISGTTKWLIIDINTRHIVRDYNFVNVFPHWEKRAIVFELEKMQAHENLQVVSNFIVPFSAIDKAQHVNNTIYMRWMVDNFLPEDFDKDVQSVEINYVHETKLSEAVAIKRFKENNTYYFEVDNESGTSVLAKIQLSE